MRGEAVGKGGWRGDVREVRESVGGIEERSGRGSHGVRSRGT